MSIEDSLSTTMALSVRVVEFAPAALAVITIVGVSAVAVWLIRLATSRNHVPAFAQRIQGPQEAQGPAERGA